MSDKIGAPEQNRQKASSGFAQVLTNLSGPRGFGLSLIVLLAALGWVWLILGAGSISNGKLPVYLGPGMDWLGGGSLGDLLAWCAQRIALPDHSIHGLSAEGFLVAFAMWAAMVAAMMLPTAYPMVVTYSEIADTARRGGKTIVSTSVLLAGYATVWLGFAHIATLAQMMFFEWGMLDHGMTPAVAWLAPVSLIFAGAYQFSQLKQACLTKCRRPFNFFFANWRTTPTGVFYLGLWQGMICLGCCWALMIAMFATGLMNLVWMAILAIIMLLEKLLPKPDVLRIGSGLGFIAWGIWLGFSAIS